VRLARLRIEPGSLNLAAIGIVLTIAGSFAAVKFGLKIGFLGVVVATIFVVSILGYLRAPHVMLAVMVPLYAFIPALIVFVNPNIGALKDLLDLAAITAMVIIAVFERRRIDRWVVTCTLLLLAIYVINPAHGHNAAWAQGVRLTGEPLLLLLVGFMLPNPRRNLRWGLTAMVATGVVDALYGLLQQLLGGARLVSLGYSYSTEVRTIGPYLRSFGTFSDPFAYAAFLLFALGIVFFWQRRGALTWATAGVILAGLAASFVRTAVLVGVGFIALELVRRRKAVPALAFVVAATVAAGITLSSSSATQTTNYTIYTAGGGSQLVSGVSSTPNVFLNGRVSAWTAALGTNPAGWLFGRGVGKVGTAAARAKYTFASSATTASTTPAQAVDSGYFATMADVGLVGLVIELLLFGRLGVLAARAARAGSDAGWVVLALLVAILLDALTRASFTGFPTAFLCLLLIGIALAAAREPAAPAS
jgi:hypothetical protein